MSSLRNAVKRRAHKERGQPLERKRFGLLEKHKDYVLRARDFHRKQDTLRALKQKAALRNPDEFAFKMEHMRTRDGVHITHTHGAKKYSEDEMKLLRTQDLRYILNRAQIESKKVERLKASLHLIGSQHQRTHLLFQDGSSLDHGAADGESRREAGAAAATLTSSSSSTLPRSASAASEPLPQRIERRREKAYRELEARQERRDKLKMMVEDKELERHVMGKGRKRPLLPTDPDSASEGKKVYRWKKERKR